MQDGMFDIANLGTSSNIEETPAPEANGGTDIQTPPVVESINTEVISEQTDANPAEENVENVAIPKSENEASSDDFAAKLKAAGFDSLEKLIEAAQKNNETPAAEPTEEEVRHAKEVDRANFISHAVNNANLSTAYVSEIEGLINSPAKDVVFNAMKADYLAANKDADEEDFELAFNQQFPVESSDAGEKALAVKMLELAKKDIISEKGKEYNDAKTQFEDLKQISKGQPEFEKMMMDTFAGIPKMLEFGEGENKLTFQSNIGKDQIFKYVEDNFGKQFLYDMFESHLSGQGDAVKKVFEGIAKLVHKELIFDSALITHGQNQKSLGAKSAVLGSKAPFSKNVEIPGGQGASQTEDLTAINSMFGG